VKALALVPLLAVLLTACGAGTAEEAASTAPPTTTQARTPMTITVYRVENGVPTASTVQVPATRAVAAAALRALGIEAPVTISGGTAHVALDAATDDRVTEIVYTLTAFPTVQRVDVAGRSGPTRADVGPAPAPIVVDEPAAGSSVATGFRVAGSASVYEATVVVEAVRDGKVLEKQTLTASEGAPGRGTYETTMQASPGPLTIRVFSPSAVDGAPQHEVDVEVTVTP
jgi:immunoglobulin-like protein involved in spore germination